MDNTEHPEYGRTEPVSSSDVVDDTMSSPLTSSQWRRELLSERDFHDHFALSDPWSPAKPLRAGVDLTVIDEDRPLSPPETPTLSGESLSALELRMHSHEADAETSFNQIQIVDGKLDSLPLKTRMSIIGMPTIDETKGTYHRSGDQCLQSVMGVI